MTTFSSGKLQNIKNTLIYIDLEHAIFRTTNNEFTCRIAKAHEEIGTLIEAGFEYVTDLEGMKLSRKRK